jgi:heme ABC exporter ATP-binding subunit CcmA
MSLAMAGVRWWSATSSGGGEDVVRMHGVVCLLGRFAALAGADLTLRRGETLLVTGANGAGKTTLLRVLAGLAPVTAGSLVVLGADLRRDPTAVRRRVALVGHATGCYEDLSVGANLRFFARLYGAPPGAADAVLEEVGLVGVADQPHRELSAGQRRRCTLAVALLRPAELLLLDEAHASLDAEGRAHVDAVVRRAATNGCAVVLVSHEPERIRPWVDREVVVESGIIRPVVRRHRPSS